MLRFCPPLCSALVLFLAAPLDIGAQQAVGPLQVSLVGDTVADEGDRVSWSLVPWPGRANALAATYTWDFGDDSSPVSRQSETAVGYRYMRDGEYAVSASDGAGTTGLSVRVRPVPPTIEVLTYVELPGPERSFQFQAVATDPGLDTLTYRWNFGDGSPEREDIDLVEVEHSFPDDEPYTVTLTVMDEDTLTAERTVRLLDPGFQGTVTGSLSHEMDAAPGTVDWPGTMTSVLPAGPRSMDACTFSAEFVDDAAQTNLALLWVAPDTSGLQPGRYAIVDPMASGAPDVGSVMVNVTHAEREETWAMLRDRGAAPPSDAQVEEESGGGIGGLLGKVKDAVVGVVTTPGSSVYRPAQGAVGPYIDQGVVFSLVGRGGTLVIEEADDEWIQGRISARLHGNRMPPRGAGYQPFAERIEVEGTFAWPLDETASGTAARCVEGPFEVEGHEPRVEAPAVDYEDPEVSVTFNRPLDRSTVREETLELGYLDASDRFQRIPTRIVHVDRRTVRLVPNDFLDDAVYHVVRVTGGEDGVRSSGGEELADDYEWRFATMPELVKRPGASRP